MALLDYKAPRATIALPGGSSFDVRGFTFNDLSLLVAEHRQEFMAAGEIIAKNADNMGSLAAVLCETTPALVASAIALAADEPDAAATVRTLPMPVQLDALLEIGRLTFTDEASVPKFLAGLTALVRAGTTALTSIR